jgi:hypothetical protein
MKILCVFLIIINLSTCKVMPEDKIKIKGITGNSKSGAVVVTDDNSMYFIDGVKNWKSSELEKLIEVEGVLKEELKKNQINDSILIQKIEGCKKTVINPSWKFL